MHETYNTHTSAEKTLKTPVEILTAIEVLTCIDDPSKIDILWMSDVVIASSNYDRILIKVRINCSLHGDALLGI